MLFMVRKLLIFATFLVSSIAYAQVKELENLRSSIFRFTQYDNGKTDSIPKSKENTERLKKELERAWMAFIMHKDSKNLDALKRDGINNRSSYTIGDHTYFLSELLLDLTNRKPENNRYYSIGFYGIYDYGLPNFVYTYIQPFTIYGKELVVYYFKLNGAGTYYIKEVESNKIIFKSEALTSNAPIMAFQAIDSKHCLMIEDMGNDGKRALVIDNASSMWKPIKAFKGKSFNQPLGDYTKKSDVGSRYYLRFAENKHIVSGYGESFLKKYELHFEEATKTVSYKHFPKNNEEEVTVKSIWQNNSFTIDDYYIGEHLNDQPIPFSE